MSEQTITNQPPKADNAPAVDTAKPLTLMWWRFRQHRLALWSLYVIIFLYFVAAFAEFLAPYDPFKHSRLHAFVPPQSVHLFHEGEFVGPFVYGLKRARDPETARLSFSDDPEKVYPIKFFHRGDTYKFWGLWESNLHLFGIDGGRRDGRIIADERRADRTSALADRFHEAGGGTKLE